MRFKYKDYSGGFGLFSCYSGDLLICHITPGERFLVWRKGGNLGTVLRCFDIQKMPAEISMLKIITSLVLL